MAAEALVSIGDRQANRQGAVTVRAYKWPRKGRRERRRHERVMDSESWAQFKGNILSNSTKFVVKYLENWKLSSRHENQGTL